MDLIIGGSGFIGSNIANRLKMEGKDFAILDKQEPQIESRWVNHDITEVIQEPIQDIDCIYHLAAEGTIRVCQENPKVCFDNNVLGTYNVAEFARKNDVKHIVFMSSYATYGNSNEVSTEEFPLRARNHYSFSKIAGEAIMESYAYEYGIKVHAMRSAPVIGKYLIKGVTAHFYQKLKSNPKEIEIWGSGEQKRNYIWVEDLISAMHLTKQKQAEAYGFYNVGGSDVVSAIDILGLLSKKLEIKPKIIRDKNAGFKGDIAMQIVSSKKLQKIGWKETKNFNQYMNEYIDWLAEQAAKSESTYNKEGKK
mgnify:CR=1 FL=1